MTAAAASDFFTQSSRFIPVSRRRQHSSAAGEQFCDRPDTVHLDDEDLDVVTAVQFPVQRAEIVQRRRIEPLMCCCASQQIDHHRQITLTAVPDHDAPTGPGAGPATAGGESITEIRDIPGLIS